MDISLNWLKEYIDLTDLKLDSITHALTDIGLEVEAIKPSATFGESVIVGRILEASKHPNADSLQLCKVDIGGQNALSIVCGAPNARSGLTVCVATVGTELPGGLKIKEAKIRGEASFGMLCSAKELGIAESNEGILELSSHAKIGVPVLEVLGLNDIMVTLNVTPNRADCLGHIGVARDLSARLNRPLKWPQQQLGPLKSTTSSTQAKVKIESDRCGRFSVLPIKNIKVVPSPSWLKSRLETCGMRSINLIVDLTNYVMLEMNHPVHAYDDRHVAGKSFVIREARAEETFKTLDRVERKLNEGDLLICDSEKPIGIAGIMGGENSEVKSDTTSILLEVAYFDPGSVRATSKRLGMHTEASHRFERGIDPAGCQKVAARFADLLTTCVQELKSEGQILDLPIVGPEIIDIYPVPIQPRLIALRISEAKNFLASPHLTQELIKKYFKGLEFRLVDHNQDRMVFEIPSWRVDIERECDLIEEIGRLQGYDKVPLLLPKMSLAPTPQDELVDFQESARVAAASLGLRETISFPFWSNDDASKLRLSASHPLFPSIKLKNPISEDSGLMQTSLIAAMLKAVTQNRRRGVKGAKLFEVGRGYFSFVDKKFDHKAFPNWSGLIRKGRHLTPRAKQDQDRPTERHWLSGIIDQPFQQKTWFAKEEPLNFFHVKRTLESWFRIFGIQNTQYSHTTLDQYPFLNPQTSAIISVNGKTLGWLGEIHPETAIQFDLEPKSVPIAFEIDLEVALDIASLQTKRSSESFKFPPTTRDLALLVSDSVTHDEISSVIAKSPSHSLLKHWSIFDVYTGEGIPAGKKSVGWSFQFQSADRTLTDVEVDQEFKIITQFLSDQFKAEQR
ncbi:MAG: phenylalanine--tRNA ligase subunit beta [Proteobacteria bacterium]|nr:phenylalanine--tRNA ligase subunit beta [Pseudomonadota bacterium]